MIALDGLGITAKCDAKGQPDSVAISPDGKFVAIAIENERDEDLNDGVIPQMPAGHLAIFDLDETGTPTNCDAVRIVDLTGLAEVAPTDPEPEFVSINSQNQVVVTLQENNHIAVVDLASGEVVSHFSAGTASAENIPVSKVRMSDASGSTENVKREPDAVAWIDDERFVTANEGDYEGGSRGFTVFHKVGTEVFESGTAFEQAVIRAGHYPDKRSDAKGVEPEGMAISPDSKWVVNTSETTNMAHFIDTESFQIKILLVPQVGNGKVADTFKVFSIFRPCEALIFRRYGITTHKAFGEIDDVLSAVAVFRPTWVIRCQTFAARLHRKGQVVNLLTCIVVVELSRHIPAGRFQ